jgi:hypothetical protein
MRKGPRSGRRAPPSERRAPTEIKQKGEARFEPNRSPRDTTSTISRLLAPQRSAGIQSRQSTITHTPNITTDRWLPPLKKAKDH